ncbi:HIV Tat-specific factor 1 [Aethina tumida]|uniref:HIV Tat-specific factor 1 n=1 Tax=Aethina tumida TaxID=116153 RepID=UPI00214985BC|nr:HIV Tat-specific factor 1 [Aethina tumida]
MDDLTGSKEESSDSDISKTEPSESNIPTVPDKESNSEQETNNPNEKCENGDNTQGSTNDESTNSTYDPKNVHYEGDVAIYTDAATGYRYQWDKEKNEWVAAQNVVYGFEDDTHVYTDADGVKYFWDKVKLAWFPKVDDDFMARYQMNYGFTETSTNTEEKPKNDENKLDQSKKVKGEKRKASEPTWFQVDDSQNTNVYVSNLPTDITEEDFINLMQKCGLVMRDPVSGVFKIKLYKEPGTEHLKGDALCTYIKIESVDLAINLLDGYDYNGRKIHVERAKFQMKGEYDPKKKPKMRKKKEKLKLKKQQEKLFDWRPEKLIGEKAKHEKVVIVKNLFDPSIFDTDVSLILEFQQDLREECSKIGEVRKVIIYDRHPEGVAQINMSNPEEAEQVVTLLNGRWFMKRQLTAEIWDGKTKFKIAETDSQITQRLDKWDEFLEGESEPNSKQVTT